MHKIENILFGIALILFGIASKMIVDCTDWGLFDLFTVISPILGMGMTIFGMIYDGKSSSNDE